MSASVNTGSSVKPSAWLSFPQQGVMPFDPWLLGTAATLVLTGFVMITSASMDVAAERFGGPFFFAQRHGFFIALAIVVSIVAIRVPIKQWEKYGPVLLGIGFVLLVLVLIPGIGREVNGSRRWISLGPLNLQASEVAKFCMVIYVGGYLVRRLSEVRTSWGGVVKPVLPLAFFVSLLLVEPDYGAAVVLMGTVMGMVFLGGMRFAQFIMVLVCAVGLILVMAIAQPYRMARLRSFQDPWADPFGSGYQLSQAQIAFGRGDWFGTGLGNSVQKLFYLPEAHTDFVYSVLAEEFGLIGALMVVILYTIMICRIFLIGREAEKQKQFFMGYIAYGFGLIFAAQALINIGVNVGALPTKGLTLPLLSYGGSSLLVCAVMISIVMRIDFELKTLRFKELPGGAKASSRSSKGSLKGLSKEPSAGSQKKLSAGSSSEPSTKAKLKIVKNNELKIPHELSQGRGNE